MGAAAEGAVRIDGAAAIAAQQRAGAVGMRFQSLAPTGTDAPGRIKRFALCQQRGVAGEAKMAATGAHFALAGKGTSLQFGIDGLDLGAMVGLGVFHAACNEHGRAGSCGTRFLQSGN